jgi:hypothetical protein
MVASFAILFYSYTFAIFKITGQMNAEEYCQAATKVADGGCKAWTVALSATWIFGLYLGFEFNYGFVYAKLIQEYNQTGNNVIYSSACQRLYFFFVLRLAVLFRVAQS